MSADLTAGQTERLHPFFLLSGIGRGLRGLTGAYALVAYFAVSGRLWTAVLIAIGLFVFAVVSVIIYWRRFEFRVGADDIRIDSGIFSRTHRSIPFDRIQDVDITQGPLQRLLGLAQVTFETGGSSGQAGKEDGVIQAIALQRAEQLRELVRSRRSNASPATIAADAPEDAPVYEMSLPRLLLSGTFNFSLALFAGLFGLTQTVGNFAGFDPFDPSFWERVLSVGGPFRAYVMGHQMAAAAAGLVLLLLVGLATGIIRTVAQDYGFRLDRTGVGLRRRRGLLTRTDVTLPARRAQAAILVSGPVRERFGYAELKLQNLAADEDKHGSHVLAPLATEDESGRILAALGWRTLPDRPDWQAVSVAYVWSRIIGLTPLYLLVIIQAAALRFAFNAVPGSLHPVILEELTPLVVTFAVTVLVVVLGIGTRWFAWRTTAYAVDRDRLLVRTGWWRRRRTILPIAKIQSIDLRESFITRWFGTASLQFGVAGGTALVAHSIPAIPREGARQLRDELLGLSS